ncbi:hypothetical protein M413DRAFT_443135 [Hebeloma cylindrosporum]|uniref:Uncharacterized protein n=1 Tax=Hebeloma cylindrosporum TaxID=76867 RepID=A0A0C3CJZ9_HEBCY|nr:hypothetical protein M413DRAFT_443135 [Hebeloma cylindrosporum h7]
MLRHPGESEKNTIQYLNFRQMNPRYTPPLNSKFSAFRPRGERLTCSKAGRYRDALTSQIALQNPIRYLDFREVPRRRENLGTQHFDVSAPRRVANALSDRIVSCPTFQYVDFWAYGQPSENIQSDIWISGKRLMSSHWDPIRRFDPTASILSATPYSEDSGSGPLRAAKCSQTAWPVP